MDGHAAGKLAVCTPRETRPCIARGFRVSEFKTCYPPIQRDRAVAGHASFSSTCRQQLHLLLARRLKQHTARGHAERACARARVRGSLDFQIPLVSMKCLCFDKMPIELGVGQSIIYHCFRYNKIIRFLTCGHSHFLRCDRGAKAPRDKT